MGVSLEQKSNVIMICSVLITVDVPIVLHDGAMDQDS